MARLISEDFAKRPGWGVTVSAKTKEKCEEEHLDGGLSRLGAESYAWYNEEWNWCTLGCELSWSTGSFFSKLTR